LKRNLRNQGAYISRQKTVVKSEIEFGLPFMVPGLGNKFQ